MTLKKKEERRKKKEERRKKKEERMRDRHFVVHFRRNLLRLFLLINPNKKLVGHTAKQALIEHF